MYLTLSGVHFSRIQEKRSRPGSNLWRWPVHILEAMSGVGVGDGVHP